MIMEARQKRLSTPLQWGRREKTAVGAVLALVLVAAIALGVYGLTSGGTARKDCVEVTFASTLGGARIHACGARARTVCASANGHEGIAPQLRAACRRVGLPFAVRG
jgi:hypothetical protein